MDNNMPWTTALGQAFAAQPGDVMSAVQRLRAKAQSLGNLPTTPQEQIVDDSGNIEIVPADPDTVYVPDYQPAQVYYDPPPPGGGWVSYGVGLPVGLWLDSDFDWRARNIFAWPRDQFRPRNWWGQSPGGRSRPPTGARGVTVWRPHDVPPRVDRGYPPNTRQAAPVPRPGEALRGGERQAPPPRQAERAAAPPQAVERPVAPPRQVERPVAPPRQAERPAAPPRQAERPVAPPRQAERPVAPPRQAERPIAPSPQAERPVAPSPQVQRPSAPPRTAQRPSAPPPRTVSAPPARGALIGAGSAGATRSYSARGQVSRSAAPSGGGRKKP
jgi:hypothetical protein